MASRALLILACSLSLGLTACSGSDTPPPKTQVGKIPDPPPPPPPPATPAAHRWVALLNAPAPCPALKGWSDRKLFRLTTAADAAWTAMGAAGSPLPAPLDRFCVYTWRGGGDPPHPPEVPGAATVDPDYDLVVPQAPAPAAPTLTSPDAARIDLSLAALGAATTAAVPAGSPYAPGGTEPLPYVAIVDTAESRGPGTSPLPPYAGAAASQRHGVMMAQLVQAVRCPHGQDRCIQRQLLTQAFPFDATSTTPLAPGGQRGSLASLASAIGEAVATWRLQPDGSTSRLVMSISVGWDMSNADAFDGKDLPAVHGPLLSSPADGSVPATLQAVHHALALAACNDVLSLAASGNARGPLCEQHGAMGPASWERLSPLEDTACAELGITLPVGSSTAGLVYGVSAVDRRDQPIAITRIGSVAPRAVYGEMVTLDVAGSPTDPWTGTSLSTAALSAMAAQVWSHAPNKSVAEVLGDLDGAGKDLTIDAKWRNAEVGTGVVRRIDAERVLARVDTARNPYVPRDDGSVGAGGSLPTASAPVPASAIPVPPSAQTLRPTNPGKADCPGFNVEAYVVGNARLPSVPPQSDITRPQPHAPICPDCKVDKKFGRYYQTIEIDPEFASSTVADPTLTFIEPISGNVLTVSLAPMPIDTGSTTTIDLGQYILPPTRDVVSEWLDAHPEVRTARLTLQVDDDGQGPNPPETSTDVIDVIR